MTPVDTDRGEKKKNRKSPHHPKRPARLGLRQGEDRSHRAHHLLRVCRAGKWGVSYERQGGLARRFMWSAVMGGVQANRLAGVEGFCC